MIIRFTNIHGHENYGIVLTDNRSTTGMMEVYWDHYAELEELILSRRGQLNHGDQQAVQPRQTWIKYERERPAPAKMEILPDKTKVRWNSAELKKFVSSGQVPAIQNQEPFYKFVAPDEDYEPIAA